MNWIYDKQTEHSRLMVGIDRWGIEVREWSDETPDDETGYSVQTATFTWEQYRNRERTYAGDTGGGNMTARLVAGAISLLGYWGGSSDSCGTVDSLGEYINGLHVFDC